MANKDEKAENPQEFLTWLQSQEKKLKILLCANGKDKPLAYSLAGRRTTKTVYMAEKLQFLMREYCIKNDLKVGDFVEIAIIEYLNRMGYEDKLKNILVKGEGEVDEL